MREPPVSSPAGDPDLPETTFHPPSSLRHSVSASASRGAPLVDDLAFLVATRDAGYRNVASAVAELIDNALQAHARHVWIRLDEVSGEPKGMQVAVLDDGEGMRSEDLARALQFGGSRRFDDRGGIGRFGMGLPNSSLSHARRVDVWTWQKPGECYHCWLDLDEMLGAIDPTLPRPVLASLPDWARETRLQNGTLVQWSRCDRLPAAWRKRSLELLRSESARTHRYAIWDGVHLAINGERVRAHDPLFLRTPRGVPRAKPFGADLVYEVRAGAESTSMIHVRFTELPVIPWQQRSVEERRLRGVVGAAGVSVVRAGREIDYGWHLMGTKRRENYDDWWRCEIRFEPVLDELFGVTFTKQGIRPTAELARILAPDMEATARELNRRVRGRFVAHGQPRQSRAVRAATRREMYLPPATFAQLGEAVAAYQIATENLITGDFFAIDVREGRRTLILNRLHPFYNRVYQHLGRDADARFGLESLLLAAARALDTAPAAQEALWAERVRTDWSDALAAFLS